MLTRQHRLGDSRQFDAVFKKGKRVGSREYVLFFMRNHRAHSRFGFVVSKKFGNAVQRNRARRLAQEAIRLNLGQIEGGFDVVVHIKPRQEVRSLWDAERCLMYLFRKGTLLKRGYNSAGNCAVHLGIT